MKIKIIICSTMLLLLGALFFLHQESWIIISLPTRSSLTTLTPTMHAQAKKVKLYLWQKNKFKEEMCEIVINNNNKAQTIQLILNQLLNAFEEEKTIDQQISVQSVILSTSGQEAFISFDQNPLNRQASTYAKLMIIESILKTLKESALDIASVRFLLHHQPLEDHELNFNISWPVCGYLNFNR
jgi:hypothetical protein